MVEHREDQGLQDPRLGEGSLDGQDRRPREEQLALGVSGHVTGEPVVPQPVAGLLVDDTALAQAGQRLVGEAEVGQGVEQAPGPGDHAVAATLRKAPGEDLERAPPTGSPVAQGGLQHGELVLVGQQAAPGPHGETCLDAHGGQPRLDRMSVAPMEVEETGTDEVVVPDKPWVTIVWNDPVNLMSYVAFVFQKHFGYSEAEAKRLMLAVHHEGRAVVSNGSREEMERDVEAMHGYGLWATMQHDE